LYGSTIGIAAAGIAIVSFKFGIIGAASAFNVSQIITFMYQLIWAELAKHESWFSFTADSFKELKQTLTRQFKHGRAKFFEELTEWLPILLVLGLSNEQVSAFGIVFSLM